MAHFSNFYCTFADKITISKEKTMANNKYISVSYTLYDLSNNEQHIIEKTEQDRPFFFISGMGVTLPAFEEKIIDLSQGDSFEFSLTPQEAYGEHLQERVIDLDRSIFTIDGKFDHEHVTIGAMIPLQNEDGNRFYGIVRNITETQVTIDLNHPLAGKPLKFVGNITESREATTAEVAKMASLLSGEGGCDGGCGGSCGGKCGNGGCGCH